MEHKTFIIFVYFLGLSIASIIRAIYSKDYRHRKIAIDHRGLIDSTLVSLPGIGMFILPIIFVSSSWLDFTNYLLPLWAGWIGALLFVLMIWLLWKSHVALGHNWSPTLQIMEAHELVTQGLYQRSRHPMYAAHLLWGIAQPLLLQNWIVGFSMLVTLIPLYIYRIPKEEKMMIASFGENYRSYINRTRRMIPYLW